MTITLPAEIDSVSSERNDTPATPLPECASDDAAGSPVSAAIFRKPAPKANQRYPLEIPYRFTDLRQSARGRGGKWDKASGSWWFLVADFSSMSLLLARAIAKEKAAK